MGVGVISVPAHTVDVVEKIIALAVEREVAVCESEGVHVNEVVRFRGSDIFENHRLDFCRDLGEVGESSSLRGDLHRCLSLCCR